MPAILGANSVTGYDVDNSLLFNSADNAELSRTLGSASGEKVFSFSTWVKRSNTGGSQSNYLLYGVDGSSNSFNWYFRNDVLRLYENTAGSGGAYITTNQKFTDISAWYHILLVYNTNESTNTNRVKIYINGSQIAVSNLTVTNWPDEDYTNAEVVKSGNTMKIGASGSNSEDFDGYLSQTYFIDGQALAPSDFGETNDNGVWVPIKYTGTFGNNGVFLEYKQTGTSQNSSGMGADTSGNDNHFATSNHVASDVVVDTPTNNFFTMNALGTIGATNQQQTNTDGMVNGNLEVVRTRSGGESDGAGSSISAFPQNGKWYYETKWESRDTSNMWFGIVNNVDLRTEVIYYANGTSYVNSSTDSSYGATYTVGDIISVAVNKDDNQVTFYKNGSTQGTLTNNLMDDVDFFAYVSDGGGSDGPNAIFNFGNPVGGFSISSGNADANGYGNFEYAPPSGYYALCSKNIGQFG
tara:strand:+ start:1257 stop:2657 length:1401 start_codon:yes stop_codon:yes gene_type:complete